MFLLDNQEHQEKVQEMRRNEQKVRFHRHQGDTVADFDTFFHKNGVNGAMVLQSVSNTSYRAARAWRVSSVPFFLSSGSDCNEHIH